MEVHQLRYFVAVAEEGNFTRAAAKRNVSQPSLSAQIIKLEDELGQKLFNRLGRRVELTQAGQLFEKRATAILLEMENARLEIQGSEEQVTGSLKVGATPSVGPFLIPPVIAACKRRYPSLTIRFEEELRRSLLENLIDGDLEVAISSYPGDIAHIAAEPVLQEDLYLVVPRGHRLASLDRVSIRDFNDEPLVVLGESNTLGERVLEFFGFNDVEPNIVALCSQVRTVKEFVDHGLGLAILPAMSRDDADTFDIVFKNLASARMNRLLFTLTHEKRYLSPGARVFIDMLREHVDELQKLGQL